MMTSDVPAAPAGAVRLGRLLRRATSGASRASLTATERRAFADALVGGSRAGRGASVRRGWWLAVAGVTVVAAAAVLSTVRVARPLTFELHGFGPVSGASGPLEPTANQGTLRFSDGSTLELRRGSRARVLDVDARGARMVVDRGDAAFRIRHRRGTRWTVAAGPYEILVTGTAFDVRWTDDRQLRVHLREGSVVIRGSLAGAGMSVKAGQTFVAREAAGEVRLGMGDGESAPGATSPPAATQAAAMRPAIAAAEGAPAPAERLRRPHPPNPSDSLTACVARCDDDELDLFAQRARRRGELDVARRALLALRERRPGSELGHEATFVLGRLAEDRGNALEALSLFDAYLDGQPGGQYRPYALGRKMALVEQIEGVAAARPLAEQYLRLYPDGAYGRHARQLLDRR